MNLDLRNLVIDSSRVFEACDWISARGFQIVAPGEVTFRAGRSLALGEGFSSDLACPVAAINEKPAGCPP